MSLQPLADQELINLYLSGNELAFAELLKRHKDRVFRYINSKVRDSDLANDLFQDAFIKVITTMKGGQYNEEGKFLPWLMRISHNLIIDHFRKTNKVRFLSESRTINEEFTIFHKLSTDEKNYLDERCETELESQMLGLLDHLPAMQREIVQMRIFQDLSFKEIAEMEDISINTALGRMRYALINMRKLIDTNKIVMEY
ncbi:MAG: sigma-70 family RNA polymerase sigma factor [Flavobacteriia bacterium]|nr:sigma-70 family RNA polymerase sigma factor [Flavobacteriia bacterium]